MPAPLISVVRWCCVHDQSPLLYMWIVNCILEFWGIWFVRGLRYSTLGCGMLHADPSHNYRVINLVECLQVVVIRNCRCGDWWEQRNRI